MSLWIVLDKLDSINSLHEMIKCHDLMIVGSL